MRKAPVIKYVKKPLSIKKNNYFLNVIIVLIFTALFVGIYPYIFNNSRRDSDLINYLLTPNADVDSVPEILAYQNNNFSSAYFTNLAVNINNVAKTINLDPKTFPEYAHIQGKMYLTIPKLGLENLPVVINVNSFDVNSYMKVLENNLAHFQGTSLPDKSGNTFIYGHSTNEIVAMANPKAPINAFTFLYKLDVNDEIYLKYNDIQYKYIVQKTKVVKANDLTPIFSYTDEKKLTLMSCWPNGIGTDRLIVVAKQV